MRRDLPNNRSCQTILFRLREKSEKLSTLPGLAAIRSRQTIRSWLREKAGKL